MRQLRLHPLNEICSIQGRVHFSELMTAKLSEDVKLVGPSINCEESATIEGDLSRSNPHVQSFAVATDQVGESPFS